MPNRIVDCIQDIINVADGDNDADDTHEKRMKKRIDQFFSELGQWKRENPNRDIEQYINRLDEKLTAASTQMGTSPAASDLLEQAINYVEERRHR